MSTKAQMIKSQEPPKSGFAVRHRNRCKLCGRPRAVYRKFGVCRICFRNLASRGLIPGVKKASW
jgi:small subunit ribosomal protein S14